MSVKRDGSMWTPTRAPSSRALGPAEIDLQ